MPSDPRPDKAPSDGSVRGESAGRGGAVGGERQHIVIYAPLRNGGTGQFCDACSHEAGDFVWPCKVYGTNFSARFSEVRRRAPASSGESERTKLPRSKSNTDVRSHASNASQAAIDLHFAHDNDAPTCPHHIATECAKPWPTSEQQRRRDSDRAYRVVESRKLRRGWMDRIVWSRLSRFARHQRSQLVGEWGHIRRFGKCPDTRSGEDSK